MIMLAGFCCACVMLRRVLACAYMPPKILTSVINRSILLMAIYTGERINALDGEDFKAVVLEFKCVTLQKNLFYDVGKIWNPEWC